MIGSIAAAWLARMSGRVYSTRSTADATAAATALSMLDGSLAKIGADLSTSSFSQDRRNRFELRDRQQRLLLRSSDGRSDANGLMVTDKAIQMR